MKMVTIRLPADLDERLEALAKATDRTKTYYVRQAILMNIDQLEELYSADRLAVAVARKTPRPG